jgi:hypothetical protein
MTTIIAIYEAAGGTVNEDRTQASMPEHMQPFDIVLRVVPISIEMKLNEPTEVEFQILLEDQPIIDKYKALGMTASNVRWVTYDETVTLPVNQVRIQETK